MSINSGWSNAQVRAAHHRHSVPSLTPVLLIIDPGRKPRFWAYPVILDACLACQPGQGPSLALTLAAFPSLQGGQRIQGRSLAWAFKGTFFCCFSLFLSFRFPSQRHSSPRRVVVTVINHILSTTSTPGATLILRPCPSLRFLHRQGEPNHAAARGGLQ